MGEIVKRVKNGATHYYLRFYEAGRRRQIASRQSSFAEAKRMLLEIEARISRGEVGVPERRASWPTVQELCEQFLQEYRRPKLKDVEKYRAQARSVLSKALPLIGKLSAGHTQQSDIIKVRDTLGQKFAAGTVYNVLVALSAVFSWGVGQKLAPHNPCKGVERPKAAQNLDFLSREEARLLLDAAAARANTLSGKRLHVGIALALYVGVRKGEILGLRWTDLDLETRRLTVARSYRTTPKSGKPRHLRMPQVLVPLLREWRKHCPQTPDNIVIPLARSETRVASKDAMLGLPGLMQEIGLRPVLHPWHQLRHTFASHLVMAGGNILSLQKILGHSDLKMTMIYAHLAPDFLDGEMEKVRY